MLAKTLSIHSSKKHLLWPGAGSGGHPGCVCVYVFIRTGTHRKQS